MENVISLGSLTRADVELVGGKGANLGDMIRAGLPVPGGFVATAAAYREFIADCNLAADPRLVRQWIVEREPAAELIEALQLHHDALSRNLGRQDIVYAVRSSATAEDARDASFAGQHDTYYYVQGHELVDMVKKCWASLWSDVAVSYRASQGIDHSSIAMAVVVQTMVASEVSGVTFTANPVTGNREEIVTECSWGMGAAIVDGRVSPDQFVFDKVKAQFASKRIADKRFMVPAVVESGASRLIPVPAALRRKETLTASQVAELITLVQRIEAHYESPQDIEWAMHENRFYILQSRPITRLGQREEDIPDGQWVLFKPLAENFTDPLLPLSQDIFGRFPLMKIINGRLYLNLAVIKRILPYQLEDHEAADLAYLSDNNQAPKLSIPKLFFTSIIAYMNYLVMGVFYERTKNLPDDFMDRYRDRFHAVVADDDIDPPDAFVKMFFKFNFFEPAGNMVMMVNLAAPRYFLLLGAMKRLLKRWLPDLREDAASYLTSGTEGILSTDMGRRIWFLAAQARQFPEVVSIIREHEPTKALEILQLTRGAENFMTQLKQFLNIHGHRALKEFELNSPRWEEDPTPIIAMIRNYLQSDIDPNASEHKVATERRAFTNEVRMSLETKFLETPLRPRWRLIRFLAVRAKYYIRMRENSRFHHIMGFYVVRLKILKIEQELLNSGKLRCRDDIFYLRWDEIADLRQDKLDWVGVEDRVRDRRMEYIRLSKVAPKRTFGVSGIPEPHVDVSGELSGQGASPGIYEGIARVVMDPGTNAEIQAGEILIAPYTDPAWTPLFLTASAAVVEVGSYLSHAGTIAREYGMPCVVDAGNCTQLIKSGDRIRVDGSRGLVSFIDVPELTDHA